MLVSTFDLTKRGILHPNHSHAIESPFRLVELNANFTFIQDGQKVIFGTPEYHTDYSHLKKEMRSRIVKVFSDLKILQRGRVKKGDGSKFTEKTVHQIVDRVHHLMEYDLYLVIIIL